MNPLLQCKPTVLPLFIAGVLACLGLLPKALAVVPPPDGGYPGFNTAEGQKALFSLTTGQGNTAVGWFTLESLTTGNFNTSIGAAALVLNTADENTATGAGALLSNIGGSSNTATGAFALFNNVGLGAPSKPTGIFFGSFNTANGDRALFSNTNGNSNTAAGAGALTENTTGGANTAVGISALSQNTNADDNTAVGAVALFDNTTGTQNAAVGFSAMHNNTEGFNNTAIGASAGANQTTGSNNVYIGAGMSGVAGENGACYIASIFSQTSAGGLPVLINAFGKLGTTTSSKRFKEDIKPMDKASEALFSLKPVSFRYKKEIDFAGTSQLGLVAEEVEKVNPDLIVRDKDGKPYSVRYDQVNAMLLNEFLKEHRKVQELEANAVRQQKQIEALTAGLQKVSAQLELNKVAPQTVKNSD